MLRSLSPTALRHHERRSTRARVAAREPRAAAHRRAASRWSRAKVPFPRPRFPQRSSLRFSGKLPSPLICDQLLRDAPEIPVDDRPNISEAAVDAVVGHAVLRKIIGSNLLRTLAAADLRPAQRIDRLFLLAAFAIVERRAQHLHRLFAVLRLR